jgi:hypothetical protein
MGNYVLCTITLPNSIILKLKLTLSSFVPDHYYDARSVTETSKFRQSYQPEH